MQRECCYEWSLKIGTVLSLAFWIQIIEMIVMIEFWKIVQKSEE